MISLWRNDAGRELEARIEALLAKTYKALRYVWVAGDSEDETETVLREAAARSKRDVSVIRHDTHIKGEDPIERVSQLSRTASAGLDAIRKDDDFCLIHESDLESPDDIVQRLLAAGHCPVAAWPVLEGMFYDTWAFRADGENFSNDAPYHARYKADEPFEVDSFGSCYMFHAADVRWGLRCEIGGAVELSDKLRRLGRALWVDPRIIVRQPMGTYVAHKPPKIAPSWRT